MWPNYKPISWDKYYAHNFNENNKHNQITSGLAVGITFSVFFTVFLLTFGCRLYNQRSNILQQSLISRRFQNSSLSELYSNIDLETINYLTPPPYELAIQMPKLPINFCINIEPPPLFTENDLTIQQPSQNLTILEENTISTTNS